MLNSVLSMVFDCDDIMCVKVYMYVFWCVCVGALCLFMFVAIVMNKHMGGPAHGGARIGRPQR